MKKNAEVLRKVVCCMLFCSMLYIASAKSRSTRGASHQLAFMGSYLMLADCFLGGKKECIITYFHFPYLPKIVCPEPQCFFSEITHCIVTILGEHGKERG